MRKVAKKKRPIHIYLWEIYGKNIFVFRKFFYTLTSILYTLCISPYSHEGSRLSEKSHSVAERIWKTGSISQDTPVKYSIFPQSLILFLGSIEILISWYQYFMGCMAKTGRSRHFLRHSDVDMPTLLLWYIHFVSINTGPISSSDKHECISQNHSFSYRDVSSIRSYHLSSAIQLS